MLDARIPLQAQGLNLEPRSNALARGMQMQGQQQNNALRMMQMQQLQAAMAQQAEQQQKAAAQEAALKQAIQRIPSPRLSPLGGNAAPTPANAARLGNNPQQQAMYELMQAGGMNPLDYLKSTAPPARKLTTVAPGAALVDEATGQPVYTAPKEQPADEFTNILTRAGIDPASPQGRAMYMQLAQRKVAPPAPAAQVNVNTPFENSFSKASGAKFAATYDQINSAGMQSSQTIANLNRMDQLLQGVDGGKLAPAGKEIASMAASFGVTMDPKLGNKEAAEALSVEMALAMRPPGSGPMTDKDFANFLLTVPGLSKTAEGRKQITATMRAKAMRDVKLAEVAQQYVAEKGVLDTGFYKVAQDFIMKNPVAPRASAQDIRSQADAILGGGR
jgi:hypothetical protein